MYGEHWREDPYGRGGEPSPASPYSHQQPSQSPEQTRLVQDSGSPVTPTHGISRLPIKRKPLPVKRKPVPSRRGGPSLAVATDDPGPEKRFTPSPASGPEQQQQQGSAAKEQTTVGEDELLPLALGDSIPPVAWLGQTSNKVRPSQWRPQYLRRRVFVAFICFFAACMVVIEALMAVSNRTNGLSSPGLEFYYLWTFGPTAVLTVVSTLWGRVEFQMMRYMPWIAMSKGPEPAAQTILVDYVSMASWKAIWKGMKHRHFLLVLTLVTAVLFKVQIVLSSSLLSLEQKDLTFEVLNVTTQRVFIDIASIRTANPTINLTGYTSSIPLALLQASRNLGLPTPNGFADGIAYQTFEAPGLDPSAVLGVNVQAFAMDVDCIDAELTFHRQPFQPRPSSGLYYWSPGNFSLKTSVCTDSFYDILYAWIDSCATRSNVNLTDLWSLRDVSWKTELREIETCFPKGSYLVARTTWELQTTNPNSSLCNNTEVAVKETLAVVCMPKYSLFPATVKKNATSVHSIQPLEPREWTPLGGLDDIFMYSFLRSPNFSLTDTWKQRVPQVLGLGYDLLVGRTSANSTTHDVRFDRDTIEKSMRKAQQYLGAMFAHTFLVEPVQGTTTGEARQSVNKLVVQPVTSHIMVGLFGVMLLFAAFMLFAEPGQLTAFTPQDPNTIIGTAALLANSHTFRESFHRSAHEGVRHLERRFGGSSYQSGYVVSPQTQRPKFVVARSSEETALPSPANSGSDTSGSDTPRIHYYWAWCLHPVTQVTALVVLAGLIASLLALLHVSERNGYIADLTGRDETYLHYLWTSLPTLVMVGVSLFMSSCNFETRLMVPFSRMKTGTRQDFSHTVGLNFLDELSVWTLFRMSKLGGRPRGTNAARSIRVLLATLMTLSAGVLTILTSTLYHSTEAGADVAIQLQQQQWIAPVFDNATFVELGLGLEGERFPDLVTSMIVNWGLDYPKWTYEDILFPAFDVEPLPAGQPMPTSIRAKVPAMQPELANCSLYLRKDGIRVNYSDVVPYYGTSLNVELGERCFFRVPSNEILYRDQFGVILESLRSNIYYVEPEDLAGNCDGIIFFWGSRKFDDERDFVAALLCNESVSFVDVDVTFKYPSMLVDSTQPPMPDESTRRPYGPGKLRSSLTYGNTAKFFPPPGTLSTSPVNFNVQYDYEGFDEFYYLLLDGRTNGNSSGQVRNRLGALPLSAFRGPDTAGEVVAAIKKASNTLSVQTLNLVAGTRLYFNQTSPLEPFRQTAPPPIAATARLPACRLVQEPAVTYLLVAVLTLILLLHICSLWPQDRHIVSNNPMSLAAAASLLADSNIFERMPADGAHLLSDKQLAQLFAGKVFRMGWFDDAKDPGSQTFTIRMFDADPACNRLAGGVTELGPHAGDTSYRGAEGVVADYQRPVAQQGRTWLPMQQRGWSEVSQDDRMK